MMTSTSSTVLVLRPVSGQLQGYNDLFHHFFAQMECDAARGMGDDACRAVAWRLSTGQGIGTAVVFPMGEGSILIRSAASGALGL
ncbi:MULTISPECIES: hypothetical protein [unclassified Chelatococcus]|uniref:hypothetical protein n=1 Tax=unclassified Chelatococcus TaxID=2638111 RepID=UPI001BCC4848|nr:MULTISPECIES: hypothetical protein [unclassified Chelatococcus]MBS7700962.1 hypothetical protein [Chelatococcus sp. YT9]MBX3555495.1 hypothetical protein [Chelatococcus sp.]